MCGIAGLLLSPPLRVDPAVLDAMLGRLAHRGPDSTGLHMDGRVGLAHARLSIIDLEGGRQPIYSEDRRLVLVANGEIYNAPELRALLTARGCKFSTGSDSETILHAYREFGDDFVERLHGMFAFALWDAGAGRLLLARDRLGIKPLFWTRTPAGLAFASEIKALLAWPELSAEVNPSALAQYFEMQCAVGEHTLLAGVEGVPPGELLSINASGEVHSRPYWDPLAIRPLEVNAAQAIELLDETLHTVTREHLRSDVPIGLFLSGGVDSAAVLALMRRQYTGPLTAFSYSGDPGGDPDLAFACSLARKFGLDHHVLGSPAGGLLDRLPAMLWFSDSLIDDRACLPSLELARAARAENLKVVFTGEGGDEVFAGYSRYRKPRFARLPAALRARGSGGFRTRGKADRWRADLFAPELLAADRHWRDRNQQAWRAGRRTFSDLARMQYTDMVTSLREQLLVKADRMLMAHGIEGRVPLLDHRVVELGLALPDHLKVRGRTGKVLLRAWAQDATGVPYSRMRKRGFGAPIGQELCGRRLDQLEQVVPANVGVRRWIRGDGLRGMFSRQRHRGDAGRVLVAVLQFALWHRLHVEFPGQCPADRQDPVEVLA